MATWERAYSDVVSNSKTLFSGRLVCPLLSSSGKDFCFIWSSLSDSYFLPNVLNFVFALVLIGLIMYFCWFQDVIFFILLMLVI